MMSRRRLCTIVVLLALGTGCASHTNASSAANTSNTMSLQTAPPQHQLAQGDASHGKQIFAENCAQCHGALGANGGIGPALTGERKRKTYAQTVAWIENPAAPMPKLYPSPLTEKDVADVATFVQSL